MASRRGSLQKLDARLRGLAKRTPDSEQFFDIIFSLTDADHKPAALDRTAAITAASFVEYALQKAIITHLKKDITESELKQLFDSPQSPLSSLSSKTIVGQSLGVIQEDERQDLDTIRAIRNAFAHSMTHIEFKDSEVTELCKTLHIAADFGELTQHPELSKHIFISCIATLFFSLSTYRPGIEKEIFDAASSPD
jgi:DNA-binding MltR family transcriptional regulator